MSEHDLQGTANESQPAGQNQGGQPDTSEGWCCDGRTYKEHAHAAGDCCQPKGKQIEDLPEEGQRKARERLSSSSGTSGEGS